MIHRHLVWKESQKCSFLSENKSTIQALLRLLYRRCALSSLHKSTPAKAYGIRDDMPPEPHPLPVNQVKLVDENTSLSYPSGTSSIKNPIV